MSNLKRVLTGLAIALAIVSLGGAAEAASRSASSRRVPFTLKSARFSLVNQRLTYTLTICTRAKSVLKVSASFAPVKRARGVATLTPGTNQYQPAGCWPAFVSTSLARTETPHCAALSCPAVIGRRYRATVKVALAHPAESRRAPVLQAVA